MVANQVGSRLDDGIGTSFRWEWHWEKSKSSENICKERFFVQLVLSLTGKSLNYRKAAFRVSFKSVVTKVGEKSQIFFLLFFETFTKNFVERHHYQWFVLGGCPCYVRIAPGNCGLIDKFTKAGTITPAFLFEGDSKWAN